MGSVHGLGRSLGEGSGNPLQYSCLGNLMSRGLLSYSPWDRKRVRHDLTTKQQQQRYSKHYDTVLQSTLFHEYCC